MSWLEWLLTAQLTIGDSHILWREIIGNVFGCAAVVYGARRSVWAWPIQMLGNVLLFTVFLGAIFDTPQAKDMWGQAGRQVFFFALSIYGLVTWLRTRRRSEVADGKAVAPHWTSGRTRLALVAAMLVGTVGFYFVLSALGSWGPLAEAWILTGSILATYGMARGWVEFWLIWLAVDAVGVPQLLAAGFYPSALMYLVYGGFVVVGFITWSRARRRLADAEVTAGETVTRPPDLAARAEADPHAEPGGESAGDKVPR